MEIAPTETPLGAQLPTENEPGDGRPSRLEAARACCARAGGAGAVTTRALFALAALCFLLPFVTVSCAGEEPVTATGAQLITLRVPGAGRDTAKPSDGAQPNDDAKPSDKAQPSDEAQPDFAQQVESKGFVWAGLAFALILGGIAAARKAPRRAGLHAMLALAGLLSLGLGVLDAASDLAEVSFLVGGKGTVLSLVSVVLLSAARGITRRVRRRRAVRRASLGVRSRGGET